MANEVIRRLFDSFLELERSLEIARANLNTQDPVPAELLTRISNYEQVLQKQRSLAEQLCNHISAGDWQEVARHIKLINGLTALVYGDARELTASIAVPGKLAA